MAKAAFGYLKLGDVKGFSTNPRFTDWIPFDSLSGGSSNQVTSATSSRAPARGPSSCVFYSAGSRPEIVQLFSASRSGRAFLQAEYWLTGPAGTKYGGHVIFTNVNVGTIQVSSPSSRDGQGGVSFELVFEKRVDVLDPK